MIHETNRVLLLVTILTLDLEEITQTPPTRPRKKRGSASLRQQPPEVYMSPRHGDDIPFATPWFTGELDHLSTNKMVECCGLELFVVLSMFLGHNGTPFRSGDEMMGARDTKYSAILAHYQGDKTRATSGPPAT